MLPDLRDAKDPLLEADSSSGMMETIKATVHIWTRKFFVTDYIPCFWKPIETKVDKKGHKGIYIPCFCKPIETKVDKQGHTAMELPSRFTDMANIPDINNRGCESKPVFFSLFPGQYGSKSKTFSHYKEAEYHHSEFKVTIQLQKALEYFEQVKLGCRDVDGPVQIVKFFKKNENPEEKIEFDVYHLAGGKPYLPKFNLTQGLEDEGFYRHDNCTTFVVRFIQNCGAKLPIAASQFKTIISLNTLISAMAGYNSVSAYELIKTYLYTQSDDNAWGGPIKNKFTGMLGILSITGVGIQIFELFLRLFVIPCLRSRGVLGNIDSCCSLITKNPYVNTTIGFFSLQLILTGAITLFDENYFDNILGLVSGEAIWIGLAALGYCIGITASDLSLDDVNYVYKPSAFKRLLIYHAGLQQEQKHDRLDDVRLISFT